MKQMLLALSVLCLFVVNSGCTKEGEPTNSTSVQDLHAGSPTSISEAERLSGLPFARPNQLRALGYTPKSVDYEVSRKAALVELLDFEDLFLTLDQRGDFHLSEHPILIQDEQGQVKLYEFIVFNKDLKPIATITNFAQKDVPDFTACVLPYVRSYDTHTAQTFSAGYPGDAPKEDESAKKLSKELLDLLKPYSASISNEPETLDFWQKADSWGVEQKGLSDEVFLAAKRKELQNADRITPSKTKWYTIPRFNNEALKRTHFEGWCGPSAMAWVYRGFYPYFQGEYIPIHGDSPTKHYPLKPIGYGYMHYYKVDATPIYREFQRLNGMGFIGINFPGAYDPMMFNLAVEYYFPDHKIAHAFTRSLKGAPRRAIHRGNPVYLVVFAKWELHYIIAFGTKDKYGWFGFHYDSWLYVTDNGATTSDHGYMPYYRNSHFFNFKNKYVKMGEFVRK